MTTKIARPHNPLHPHCVFFSRFPTRLDPPNAQCRPKQDTNLPQNRSKNLGGRRSGKVSEVRSESGVLEGLQSRQEMGNGGKKTTILKLWCPGVH